jgi:S-adenosyl methyltransferase
VQDDWEHDATRRAKAALIDTKVPNAARVWNHLSGGRDNFEVDRRAARTMAAASVMGVTALAALAFKQRVVTYLVAEAGVRQFLDLGAGLTTSGSTHEIAQSLVPECKIVYVDNDPVVLSHARALLKSAPGGATSYLDCDVQDVGSIIAGARETLDFGQPVAVLLLATLAFVEDTMVEDTMVEGTAVEGTAVEGTPAAVVSALTAAVPAGSYVAISHLASDVDPALSAAVRQWNAMSEQRLTLRSSTEVAALVTGLVPVPPGLVPVSAWHPDPAIESQAEVPMHGIVARKP